MAIFTPSESPTIVKREVDRTGGIVAVQSSTGATVGNYRWGPVEVAYKVANETELAATFGTPNQETSVDFHSAVQFLRYSGSLEVVRVVDANARNSYSVGEGGSAPSVKNREVFDNTIGALDSDGQTFIAKWPGLLGNSLKVSMCPPSSSNTIFDAWSYKSSFDAAPGTSDFASAVGGSNDEVHVAVIDEDGAFSGTRGTVLEVFPFVSIASNAKNADGSSNYVRDVMNNRSQYIWLVGFSDEYVTAGAGTSIDNGEDFILSSPAVKDVSLSGGVDSGTLTPGDIAVGFTEFNDVDTISVDFLIAPSQLATADQITVTNNLVSIAGSTRRDCVAVSSPAKSDVVNTTTPVDDTLECTNLFTSSSYLVVDNNYLKIYDKYNDEYIYVPAASSTAGIMAATDLNAAPWFSPAGSRRGLYLGITQLAYSPSKNDRDELYKAGVNPIANIPGQGVLLYGDKTKLARPSAFDRINVRRLFLTVERSIGDAARNVMFQFNDEFTRAEFVNVVEPFLREIKGRRGITDFKVVCDESNNTPEVVDRNEFVATIFIKPARSINYITLNFVAVRSGVEFEEVVGTV